MNSTPLPPTTAFLNMESHVSASTLIKFFLSNSLIMCQELPLQLAGTRLYNSLVTASTPYLGIFFKCTDVAFPLPNKF